MNIVMTFVNHQQAVKTKRHACAIREPALERLQEVLVKVGGGKACQTTLMPICLETSSLFIGIGKLDEAIGDLDPAN